MPSKNLIKINDIRLYVAFTKSSSDCFEAINFLKSNNIPYILMNYSDIEEHQKNTIAALNTWRFGPNSEEKTFEDFPIVTWEECFDDWSKHVMATHGLKELLASDLLEKKNLIS